MVLMSAGMGERFAQTATELTEKIRKLGPNPVRVALQSARQRSAA
jgi:F420-non-reducing hydrogenase iron-sulfur subunit